MFAGAQADVAVAADQAQQEPDLFLSPVGTAPFAAHPLLRHLIAHPVARAADDPHMLGFEADFLVQFAVHGLLGRFALVDATLRKLPGMFAYALAPKNLVTTVDQNDADVRAKAFTIEHDAILKKSNCRHFSTFNPLWKGESAPESSGGLIAPAAGPCFRESDR